MFTTFFTKIIDFFTVLILKNLKKIGDFAVLLLAIGIVTFAVYYSDNRQIDCQNSTIITDKQRLDDCETQQHRKDSAINALYERLITTNKTPISK